MKKLLFFALFGTGFAQLQAQTIPKGEPMLVTDLAKANNAFAVNFYKQLFPKEALTANIFYSPYSVSSAFSLLFAGTTGESEKDIAKTFGWDKNTTAHATTQQQLTESISAEKSETNVTFRVANRLFLKKGNEILPDFQSVMKNQYKSGLEEMDFSKSEAAAQHINTWVESQTNNKIKNLVPASVLNAGTTMVLVNTVYFLGDFMMAFDAKNTQKADFRLNAQEKKQTDFMNGHYGKTEAKHFRYKKNEDYEALEMPYKGGKMAMLVVLPSEKVGLSGLINKLNPKMLNEFSENLETGFTKAIISLPKWKHEFSAGLNQPLTALGLGSIFKSLNFSKAFKKGSFVVSAVLHKAFIEVSEKGTEAAAATTYGLVTKKVIIDTRPHAFEFKADRPFLYFIMDKTNGTVLFMGQYVKPS
jgi:serpin B